MLIDAVSDVTVKNEETTPEYNKILTTTGRETQFD
jgi:hypothetical protein